MFNDDTRKFLDWLDPQIDKTLAGEDTPLNFIVWELIKNQNYCPLETSDAVCYIIIETIMDVGPKEAIDTLQIKFDKPLSNAEMCELLLILPIHFIFWMQIKENPT